MVDMRWDLNFNGSGAVINPSLLLKDGEVVVTARWHMRETKSFKGSYKGEALAVSRLVTSLK